MRHITAALPVVAVVGRPNVGKSTLVNRIIGRREAVVEDVPGVTRDRVAYDADWAGRSFTVLDTGGWDPRSAGLAAEISAAAQLAVELADVAIFVVDAVRGATEIDAEVARILRRSGKPVVLAANKVDDLRTEADASALWSLGLGEPLAVSALHGRGSGDLLDAVVAAIPDQLVDNSEEPEVRRVALVGKPNVGKSSLLNRLAGETRALVDNVAGTTRDPVDSLIQIGESTWRFVDTAGLRRKVKQASGSEYYSSLRTAAALEAAEVAVVLLDASEVLSEQDIRVMEAVIESGRAMVIVFNKWDLVDEDRRLMLDKEIDREIARVSWAPRLNLSALTGRGVGKLATALDTALAGWETRVSTARLNQFLSELIAATPPPVRGGKQPRVLFATQPETCPPRFVLFTTGPLEASYRRFIERRLREEFGFVGTPIDLAVKPRVRRGN